MGLTSRSTFKQTDTNTVTPFCPVWPLRSSLMNIISVYRKQAFITSSKLATRHSELHSSAHIRIRVHAVARCLTHFSAWTVSSLPNGHLLFILPPLAQLGFITFDDLLLCLLLFLSKCWVIMHKNLHCSACCSPSVSNLRAIRAHTHTHRLSPHGPPNRVVQLACKPASLKCLEKLHSYKCSCSCLTCVFICCRFIYSEL